MSVSANVAKLAEQIEGALRSADRLGAAATALWLDRALVEVIADAARRGLNVEEPTEIAPYGRVLVDEHA